ncbi:MAG: hypothetical protein HOV81_04045 [Kofleriaceae bacterium]|nr:hypothetical protein [Kofleriaceae bacterium]
MKRALVLCLVAACGTNGPGDGDGYGSGLGTPENPIPQSGEEGPYEVASRMDFTVEQLLPPQVEFAVVTLRTFSTNPARALVDAADHAGVPAVGALYNVIPGFIKDRLEGWINDELAKVKINGKTLQQYAGEVAALAETALTQFQIDSTLAMEPGTATHTLVGIDFAPAGFDVQVPITGLAADVLTQHPTITVTEGGALGFGEQHFGLNIGDYAWTGVNAASVQLFGADIRTALGNGINCSALAHTIAGKCALNVCVGHETELRGICEGGLDAIVNTVHGRFTAMNLDVFRFVTGEALLVDDDQDGIADRIVDGTWDGELNIGLGLRKAPATFTASR